jgi:DNA replication protein DnaC
MEASSDKCNYCGCGIEPTYMHGFRIVRTVCDSSECKEKAMAYIQKREAEARRNELRKKNARLIKPPLVLADTDIKQFPHRLAKFVEDWNPSVLNVIIHGQTRCQKTRAAWLILLKAQDAGYRCMAMTMRDFELIIEDGYENGDHGKRLAVVCNVDALLIDDLGKERPTPRMATDLFQVIDHRSSHKLITIITTNFTSDGIERRFKDGDAQLASALVARLKEFYTPFGANGT